MEKPSKWEIEPDEYMGIDTQGRTYWRVIDQIFRHKDGFTSWQCTVAAFPEAVKLWHIT